MTDLDKLAAAASLQEQSADALADIEIGSPVLKVELEHARKAMMELADTLRKYYRVLLQQG